MVEKSASVYDTDSVGVPLLSTDYREPEGDLFSAEVKPPVNVVKVVESPAVDNTGIGQTPEEKDRERIFVAGVGSAVLGLLLCGPILAVVLGFGGAYAAEKNEVVRDKVGDAWEKIQKVNKENRITERGVQSVGKGVYWLVERVTHGRKRDSDATAETQVSVSPTSKSVVY